MPSMGMAMNSSGKERLWLWFGLSRASFLVLPRVLMHNMSEDWQNRMACLLEEWDEKYEGLAEEESCFTVRSTKGGKIVRMPEWLRNYRYPKIPRPDDLPGSAEGCGGGP